MTYNKLNDKQQIIRDMRGLGFTVFMIVNIMLIMNVLLFGLTLFVGILLFFDI